MNRSQKIEMHFAAAWAGVERGRLVKVEAVPGSVWSIVKVADEYYLGVHEQGQPPTQRRVDHESAEQIVKAIVALQIDKEEKMSKGERQ